MHVSDCLFVNETATTEIYTLSLRDALPICTFLGHRLLADGRLGIAPESLQRVKERVRQITRRNRGISLDRKTTRLNSSHANISYAVFCLKNKTVTGVSPCHPLADLSRLSIC